MVVNRNINKNVFLLLIVFALGIFTFFTYNLVKFIITTKDYVKVEAEVVDIVNHYAYSPDGDSIYHYVKLKYEYKGQIYEQEKRIGVFLVYPKIGKKMKIKINPNNALEIKDTYMRNFLILVSSFSLLFTILLTKAYFIRRKMGK